MLFFCFKQKTAYDMRISDWSSDVCSSDLGFHPHPSKRYDGHQWRASRDLLTDLDSPLGDDACDRCNDMHMTAPDRRATVIGDGRQHSRVGGNAGALHLCVRSEEHTSELQSLMRISYAVLCLKKKTQKPK